jgi:hypothetical protein
VILSPALVTQVPVDIFVTDNEATELSSLHEQRLCRCKESQYAICQMCLGASLAHVTPKEVHLN